MGQLVLSVKIREHYLNSSIKYQPEVRYTWLEYPLLCWNLLSGHQFKISCTFAVHMYKYVIFKGKGLGDRCTARAWGWIHVAHIERLHTWMCSFRLLVALGLFIFACLRKVCNCMTFFLIFPLTSHTLIMFVGKTQHQFEVFCLFPLPGCTFRPSSARNCPLGSSTENYIPFKGFFPSFHLHCQKKCKRYQAWCTSLAWVVIPLTYRFNKAWTS